jgi:Histidine kinase-, DNA gyrase B-, and HSP90-like ATPase
VPLVEVLRGAIGEVEDYTRVDLVASADGLIARGAVADVTHLLAELIENAANYSPPGTRVTVAAGMTASGLAVEVEDRGLGIPPQTLAALNDRLANPPEFDLADTDQLGLFVVSRLAARQEIRVALRGSPYGGMTAIVLLPQRIVVRKDALADPPRTDAAPGVTAGASRRVRRAAAAEAGLPRRSPQANLAPQLKDAPPGQAAAAGGPSRPDARSADQARALIASIRQGWRSGSTGTDGPEPDHDANNDGTQSCLKHRRRAS